MKKLYFFIIAGIVLSIPSISHGATLYTATNGIDMTYSASGPCGAYSTNCASLDFVPTATFTAYAIGYSGTSCAVTSTLAIRSDWLFSHTPSSVTNMAVFNTPSPPNMMFVCGKNTYIDQIIINGGASNNWTMTPTSVTFVAGTHYWIDIDPEGLNPSALVFNLIFFDNQTQFGETISFLYPKEGSTTPPFSPWLLSTGNTLATNTYTASIHWEIPARCFSWSLQGFFLAITAQLPYTCADYGIYSDTSQPFLGTSSIAIPRPNRNLAYPNDTNTQDDWTAIAYLRNETQGMIVATTSVDFTLLRYGGSYNTLFGIGGNVVGTSTYVTPTILPGGGVTTTQQTSDFTAGGINPSSTTPCAGDTFSICTVGTYLFTPHQTFTDAMQSELAVSYTRFPISLLTTFVGTASSSLANPSATYESIPITIPAYAGQTTTTINLLPTNLWTDANASALKNIVWPIVVQFMWLCTAIGSIAIIFKTSIPA